MKISRLALSALLTAFCFAAATPAMANPKQDWKKKHPRRAQVLKRDNRLHNRTENAEQNGKITEGQENRLNKEEGAIRNQEQADAAANGGHITKQEQRDLNREENGVNRQLRRDERRDRRRHQQGATPAQPAQPGQPGDGATPAQPATPPANQ